MSLIEFERGNMWGNSESSLAASNNSLTMAENCVLAALIVTSTMPLEREILASLRTFDGSGLLLLDRVCENLSNGFWDANAVPVNCQRSATLSSCNVSWVL